VGGKVSKEKQREYYKKWYEKNKDKARKYKRENMRKYRAANPEKYREQSRKAKQQLKNKIFEMYGRQCARRINMPKCSESQSNQTNKNSRPCVSSMDKGATPSAAQGRGYVCRR